MVWRRLRHASPDGRATGRGGRVVHRSPADLFRAAPRRPEGTGNRIVKVSRPPGRGTARSPNAIVNRFPPVPTRSRPAGNRPPTIKRLYFKGSGERFPTFPPFPVVFRIFARHVTLRRGAPWAPPLNPPREPRPNGGLALASSSARNGREPRLRGRSLKVAASLLLPPTTFRRPGVSNYLKWWS